MEYEVRYSNRKTLGITVERDRRVVVRAPHHVSPETIERVVLTKQQWIREKLHHTQKYPAVRPTKEFVSGESLLYMGVQYRLSVVDEDIEGICFEQEFIISRKNRAEAHELFKAWYMNQATSIIKPLAFQYAERLGVQFSECKVSEMKYRWGSCTPKDNIIFNWRIVKAPLYVIHYLVVHELAHLLEGNHSRRFWTIVSLQAPQYQKAKEWLKNHGAALEVDF
jgi:predicted metal-dependent hydrolase